MVCLDIAWVGVVLILIGAFLGGAWLYFSAANKNCNNLSMVATGPPGTQQMSSSNCTPESTLNLWGTSALVIGGLGFALSIFGVVADKL